MLFRIRTTEFPELFGSDVSEIAIDHPGIMVADDGMDLSASGSGLHLVVGARQSQSFAVRGDVYAALRRDALRFFYHQRASSSIDLPEPICVACVPM